jgi:hypothetical protein
MLTRGVVGLATDAAGEFDTIYRRLDAAIYSPLCLALGRERWRAGRTNAATRLTLML